MRNGVTDKKSKLADIYSKDFVAGLFDSMSSTYGFMNYVSSFGFAERWRHQFIKKLPKHSNLEVGYDLMTGMGEVWASFDDRFKNSKVIGLDISTMMLTRAAKNIARYRFNISIQQADVLDNSIASNSADFIVSSFGLKTFNLAQQAILASEVARILKPGGVFSFVEISVPQNVLRPFYMFYLKRVIPLLGKVFQGNADNYRMLGKYTTQFKDSKSFCELLAEQGLKVSYNSYFFGCATGVSGKKIK